MGGATVGVGLLPGASTIGVAAPIILITLRFAQGLAVGGEWGGAALLTAEYAPPDRRGRFTVYPQLGPGAAFGLTSLTFLVIGHTMSPEAFLAWGWRVPFLLSVILLGIGLYVRLRIEDTPVLQELVRRQRRSSAPIREAFRNQTGPILLVAGALSAVFGFGYWNVGQCAAFQGGGEGPRGWPARAERVTTRPPYQCPAPEVRAISTQPSSVRRLPSIGHAADRNGLSRSRSPSGAAALFGHLWTTVVPHSPRRRTRQAALATSTPEATPVVGAAQRRPGPPDQRRGRGRPATRVPWSTKLSAAVIVVERAVQPVSRPAEPVAK